MQATAKPKILMVYAHPDDELIWGWPVLQNPAFQVEVLVCVSDAHNPNRRRYAHRVDSLARLCDHLGVGWRCLDLDSDFAASPQRPAKGRRKRLERFFPFCRPRYILRDVAALILEAVAASDCDAVMTHNPWGEYGHMDHMFLSSLLFANCRKPLYTTDAFVENGFLPLNPAGSVIGGMLAGGLVETPTLERAWYEECAAFYRSANVWSWGHEPHERVGLYRFVPGGAAS